MSRVILLVRKFSLDNPGGITFFLGLTTLNISNFVFHILASRLLGPSQYGELGSLLNLLLIFTVPMGAVQAAYTQAVARQGHSLEASLGGAVFSSLGFGTALALGIYILSPFINSYLHLSSVFDVVLLGIWLPLSIVAAVFQGTLMGRLSFRTVAAALVVGTGISRILFGLLFVKLGFQATGALVGSVLGQLVTTILLLFGVGHLAYSNLPPKLRVELRSGVLSILALGGYWALASEDSLLARHYLSPTSAGYYNAAATAGKIALFLPAAISLLAFPKFALHKGQGAEAARHLRWTLSLTTIFGFTAAIVILSVPHIIVTILFGHSFDGAIPVVRVLGFEAAFLGLVGVVTYYHLARNSLWSLYPWTGAALALAITAFIHHSPMEIAVIMLSSSAAIFLVMVMAPSILNSGRLARHQREAPQDMTGTHGI